MGACWKLAESRRSRIEDRGSTKRSAFDPGRVDGWPGLSLRSPGQSAMIFLTVCRGFEDSAPATQMATSNLLGALRSGGTCMREWVLAESNHSLVRAQRWEVAVLPFGATEPHNLHMPYGTDNFEVEEVGRRACEFAYNAGAKVLLLPTIPYGVNTNHLKIPGALACSVTPSTLLHLLTDLVDSLERQGIRKMV